jgi:hypothetical protein
MATEAGAREPARSGRPGREAGWRPRRGRGVLCALLASGALALAAGGCAAGRLLPGGPGGGNPMAYAQCMRNNGVPDFPDPRGGGFSVSGNMSGTTVNGVTLQETQAQYSTAEQACRQYQGAQNAGGPASPQQQQAALAYAQCMRAHGVPDFPDPKVTAHSFTVHIPSGTDAQSPQFQAAQTACQSLMPEPPGRRGAGG